jgi:hypothetical protein
MTPPRRILSALLVVAFALAAGLSVAPQLHEWLHKVGEQPSHECAATLISSGGVEHSDCAPVFVAPQTPPSVPAYQPQRFPRVLASFAFARLEHAPPVAH